MEQHNDATSDDYEDCEWVVAAKEKYMSIDGEEPKELLNMLNGRILIGLNRNKLHWQSTKLVASWDSLTERDKKTYNQFVCGVIEASAFRLEFADSEWTPTDIERVIYCLLNAFQQEHGNLSPYLKGWRWERGLNNKQKLMLRLFGKDNLGYLGVACFNDKVEGDARYQIPLQPDVSVETHITQCKNEEGEKHYNCKVAMEFCKLYAMCSSEVKRTAYQLLRDIFARRLLERLLMHKGMTEDADVISKEHTEDWPLADSAQIAYDISFEAIERAPETAWAPSIHCLDGLGFSKVNFAARQSDLIADDIELPPIVYESVLRPLRDDGTLDLDDEDGEDDIPLALRDEPANDDHAAEQTHASSHDHDSNHPSTTLAPASVIEPVEDVDMMDADNNSIVSAEESESRSQPQPEPSEEDLMYKEQQRCLLEEVEGLDLPPDAFMPDACVPSRPRHRGVRYEWVYVAEKVPSPSNGLGGDITQNRKGKRKADDQPERQHKFPKPLVHRPRH